MRMFSSRTMWPPTVASSGSGIKWHPGHYIRFTEHYWPSTAGSILATFKSRMDTVLVKTNIAGVMINGSLSAFESSQGVYDFVSVLDGVRAYIRDHYPTKRLMISLGTTNNFGINSAHIADVIPSYITGDSGTYGAGYDGTNAGYWQLGTFGAAGAWWRSAFQSRLNAFYAALAAKASPYGSGTTYDTDPFVELITYGESSLSLNSVPSEYGSSGVAGPAIKTAWGNLTPTLAANFTQTMWADQINFLPYRSAADTNSLVNADAANGIAVSSPDIFYPHSSFTWGQASYDGTTAGATAQLGVVPYIAMIQYPDFDTGSTLLQMFTMATTNLAASHCIWDYRNDASIGDFDSSLIPFIDTHPIPTGNKVCPSAFGVCNIS